MFHLDEGTLFRVVSDFFSSFAASERLAVKEELLERAGGFVGVDEETVKRVSRVSREYSLRNQINKPIFTSARVAVEDASSSRFLSCQNS